LVKRDIEKMSKDRNFIPPSQNTLGLPGENSEETASAGCHWMASPLRHVWRDNPAGGFAKQNRRGQYRYHGHAYGVSMRQECFAVTFFVLIFLAAASALAQSAEGLSGREFATWHFKLGMDERFRYEYRNDFDFSDANKDNGSLFFNRARVNLKAFLTDAYLNNIADIFVEGMDCQVGSYQAKQTAQKDNFDLHQSYLDVYNMLGIPADFKIGRQELQYGKGRLIAAPTWSNLIRSFDAAVFHYHPGQFYADLLYGQVVKNFPTAFDRSSDEEEVGGIYAGYRKNNALREGYFLTQVVTSGQTAIKRYTVGLRLQANLPHHMDIDIEAPYQFGETGKIPIRAYAFHADIAKTFDWILWHPKMSLAYDEASGNQKPNGKTNNTFVPLYQTTHEPYGLMDFFRWENVHNPEFSITFYPAEKLRFTPQVDFFWLDSKYDSWYNSSGTAVRTDTSGVKSSYVGTEASLRVCYDFTKDIKAEIGYAHFFTGGYVKETGAGDDANWVYSQVVLKY
jgi:hypothetical protein